jgi:polysaccharide export outer membrane protein
MARSDLQAGDRAVLRTALGVALVSLLAAGCASEPKHRGREVEMDEVTFSFDKQDKKFDLFTEYHVVPGDILDVLYQVKTWLEQEDFKLGVDHVISVKFPRLPELNETQSVRPDGMVTLPFLGDRYVVGRTVKDLTAELKTEYAKHVKDAELYVVVPEFRSAIKELKADLHTAPRGLSRLVTVRPDGFCTFGMIGDVFVADKTLPEINDILNKKYRSVLPGLSVDLFLEQHEGSVVYVLGEVGSPGAHKILRPTAVVEVLALAGNPLPTAKLSSVVVVRRRDNKMVGTKVNLNRALSLRKGGQFFFLKPDDIVFVPKRMITRVAEVVRDIEQIVMFRGWGISLGYSLDQGESVPAATAEAMVGQ